MAEHPPLAVAVPRSVGQVQELVQGARALGFSLATRGAGLSYSAGYIPSDARTVIVDMTAMDRVMEINTEDRFVTVEPGVTWAALHEALAAPGPHHAVLGHVLRPARDGRRNPGARRQILRLGASWHLGGIGAGT